MTKQNEPSEAEVLASIISGTGQVEAVAAQRNISARIDVFTLARVDAMAHQAKKSRNEMMNLLLEVACDEVSQHLKAPVIEKLQNRQKDLLQSATASEY